MPSPEEFRIESFLSRLGLVRVYSKVFGNESGLSEQLPTLPSHSQPVNIFHIHLPSILWRVTDVLSIQISLEDASRLLASRESSQFHCGIEAFSHRAPLCSGGKQTTKTCKHKNYWPTTPFKVHETLSLPLGQLMPWPYNISGLFPCKGWLERFHACLFFHSLVFSLAHALYETSLLYALELWTH